QLLVGGPGRRVERRLRGGMVGRGVAKGADRDAVAGYRERMAQPLARFDRHRRPQRLRQVRGERRGLWQHPQRLAAPDLVAATAGRVLRAGGKRERRIHLRSHPSQLAAALGLAPTTAVSLATIALPSWPELPMV